MGNGALLRAFKETGTQSALFQAGNSFPWVCLDWSRWRESANWIPPEEQTTGEAWTGQSWLSASVSLIRPGQARPQNEDRRHKVTLQSRMEHAGSLGAS